MLWYRSEITEAPPNTLLLTRVAHLAYVSPQPTRIATSLRMYAIRDCRYFLCCVMLSMKGKGPFGFVVVLQRYYAGFALSFYLFLAIQNVGRSYQYG